MRYLDLSFSDPAHNLACDEALLEWCEAEHGEELLRVWQSTQYFVVAGHANKISLEVDAAACAADSVPVLRRCSGGGTVLQGPGCLNYALILAHHKSPALGDLLGAYRFVLQRHQRVFTELMGEVVTVQGTSDLAIAGRKFSGNSQYRKRTKSLVHGTLLLHFDLTRVARYLRMPSKEPAYRRRRPHGDFLRNLKLGREVVIDALRATWGADEDLDAPPLSRINELARTRYLCPQWNLKF
jgi:lipoate-protein ligase A